MILKRGLDTSVSPKSLMSCWLLPLEQNTPSQYFSNVPVDLCPITRLRWFVIAQNSQMSSVVHTHT